MTPATENALRLLALACVALPFAGSLALFVLAGLSERAQSRLSGLVLWGTFAAAATTLCLWITTGAAPIELAYRDLYAREGYSFPFLLTLDWPAAAYLLLSVCLGLATAKYSRYYLHREPGYRRYFTLMLLLVTGSNLIALAGTLDLLFAGWELVGLSSFFLIAFYWRRTQPARNALVAFTVYRVCDAGVLAGTLLSHVLWTNGDRFLALQSASPEHSAVLAAIAGLIVLASLGKSAQFPFMNWLPRALEGPTPSSAIFYGALSIHAGSLLLIRTEPLWGHYPALRIGIAAIGLVSAFFATTIGRTLSNIKGQIAYAAITQVGLIYIELSLGLTTIALIHMVLHSFLRAYQLLISPSIMSHALRVIGAEQPVNVVPLAERILRVPLRPFAPLRRALYRLSLSDFYLWPSRTSAASTPIARLQRIASTRAGQVVQWALPTFVLVAITRPSATEFAATALCGLSLAAALHGWRAERSVRLAWFCVGLSIGFAGGAAYLSGGVNAADSVVPWFAFAGFGWLAGWIALRGQEHLPLTQYHGRFANDAVRSHLLVLSLIVLAAMPLTPAFVAEDLLLHWTFEHSPANTVVLVLAFSACAVATARIFVKLCFGSGPSSARARL